MNGQTWVHFTCVLWAKYCYRQVKRLLKDKRKKISVEVEVIESHEDENGVEIIDKFTFDGFSLLGEDVTEAIPNAHLTILDKVKWFKYNYTRLENGDASSIDNINKLSVFECQLIIGDKTFVENVNSDGSSTYSWEAYNSAYDKTVN